jgi:hypothetical protein
MSMLIGLIRTAASDPALADQVIRCSLDHGQSEPWLKQLKNKTSDELLAMQKFSQDQLKRYEQALRTATSIMSERIR